MLEDYLNKEVVVEEKLYNTASTIYTTSDFAKNLSSKGMTNVVEGILTNISNDYIELNNKMLITKKHIYRITLK